MHLVYYLTCKFPYLLVKTIPASMRMWWSLITRSQGTNQSCPGKTTQALINENQRHRDASLIAIVREIKFENAIMALSSEPGTHLSFSECQLSSVLSLPPLKGDASVISSTEICDSSNEWFFSEKECKYPPPKKARGPHIELVQLAHPKTGMNH